MTGGQLTLAPVTPPRTGARLRARLAAPPHLLVLAPLRESAQVYPDLPVPALLNIPRGLEGLPGRLLLALPRLLLLVVVVLELVVDGVVPFRVVENVAVNMVLK